MKAGLALAFLAVALAAPMPPYMMDAIDLWGVDSLDSSDLGDSLTAASESDDDTITKFAQAGVKRFMKDIHYKAPVKKTATTEHADDAKKAPEDKQVAEKKLTVEKMAAPAEKEVQKATAPEKKKVEKAAAPAEKKVEKTAAPAEKKVEKAAAPAEKKVEKAAAPAEKKVEKAAAPAEKKVEKAAAPAEKKVEKAAAPAEKKVEKAAAPAEQKAEKAAAPAEKKVEKTAVHAKEAEMQPASPAGVRPVAAKPVGKAVKLATPQKAAPATSKPNFWAKPVGV